jgi:hypothetical protein
MEDTMYRRSWKKLIQKVEDLVGAVVVAAPHVAEVDLGELSGKALEADDPRNDHVAQPPNQLVDGVLAAGIAHFSEAPEDLHDRQVVLDAEDLSYRRCEGDGHRGGPIRLGGVGSHPASRNKRRTVFRSTCAFFAIRRTENPASRRTAISSYMAAPKWSPGRRARG